MTSEPGHGRPASASQQRRGSLLVVRLFGVAIYLHWSWLGIAFLLLLGFRGQLGATYPELATGRAWGLAALGSIALLGSVLIHELAHALVARSRGIEVEAITLFLFGGATEADASSQTAGDELAVAIVGPLTSIGLAIVLWFASGAIGSGAEALAGLIGYLAAINVALAVFNMTPGLPLDGGRVFRAIVWSITDDFQKATRWASATGVLIGYFIMGIGLVTLWQGSLGGAWLAAIGWMISHGATATSEQEEVRRMFADLVASDVMTTDVRTIPAESTVTAVIGSHFRTAGHTAFPVIDQSGVVGMLGLRELRELRQVDPDRWETASAGEAASPIEPAMVVTPDQPMVDVIAALSRSTSGSRVLVIDGGRLVGIVSTGDIVRRRALASLFEDAGAATA